MSPPEVGLERPLAERPRKVLPAALAALVGAAGSFVLSTIAMDTMADTALVGLSACVAFLFVLAIQGASGLRALRAAERGSLALAASGGALALWAAPLLTLSQRASDSPSGADVLFMTTSAWGLAVVAASFGVRSQRPPVTALAGAVACVAGAAGLLVSWESPSSFAPFAKFPVREALMLAAGVLFAAGVLALATAARKAGTRVAALAGLGSAAALGLVSALPSLPAADEIGRGALFPCLYLGVMGTIFALGWIHASNEVGVSRASVPLFGVPIAVMSLSALERVTTVYGPDPVNWPAALSGAAVIIAGCAVVWLAVPVERAESTQGRRLSLALGIAVAGFAAAAASLLTPALSAVSEGGTGVPFRAEWTMVGAESASGWLVLAAAGLTLASVWMARRGGTPVTWVPAAVAAVVACVAVIPLRDLTLHTWNRWVPADVQQTYGTEYSRLVTGFVVDPTRLVAVVLSLVALVLVAATVRRAGSAGQLLEEDAR